MEASIIDLISRFPNLTRKLLTSWESRGWIRTSLPGSRGRGRSRKYTEHSAQKIDLICRYQAVGHSWEDANALAERDLMPRVLVVESDPLCAKLIESALGGFCVTEIAHSAEHAVRHLKATDRTSPGRPRVLILNSEIPLRAEGPASSEAGELVRRVAAASNLCVLTTTANPRGYEASLSLVKPYSLASLKGMVLDILHKKEIDR